MGAIQRGSHQDLKKHPLYHPVTLYQPWKILGYTGKYWDILGIQVFSYWDQPKMYWDILGNTGMGIGVHRDWNFESRPPGPGPGFSQSRHRDPGPGPGLQKSAKI